MVTELEVALWNLGPSIRRSRFSATLQNARFERDESSLPHPGSEQLMWATSFYPAIQRAFAAREAERMERGRHTDPPTWEVWNRAALRAMARVAAKCWSGIDHDQRVIFVDEDLAPPIFGLGRITGLRDDVTGPSLRFDGLDAPDVADSLRKIYAGARRTPAYLNALAASKRLSQSRELLVEFALRSKRARDELSERTPGTTLGDAKERFAQIVRTAYANSSVEEVAAAFRTYNELVHRIIWAILGLAEAFPEPTTVRQSIGSVRCERRAGGEPIVRLTSFDELPLFTPSEPVWIGMGLPIDGLYNLTGYTMSLASLAAFDLILEPIRWRALQWFEASTPPA
jgi:hypothetical protein